VRAWVLISLGRRWTTRIIIIPGEPLVRRGPYRFVAHPNYLVVIGEIAILPLCLGLPLYAIIFSIANALVLTIRIRAENAALAESRGAANG
jgi:methyltransferase